MDRPVQKSELSVARFRVPEGGSLLMDYGTGQPEIGGSLNICGPQLAAMENPTQKIEQGKQKLIAFLMRPGNEKLLNSIRKITNNFTNMDATDDFLILH